MCRTIAVCSVVAALVCCAAVQGAPSAGVASTPQVKPTAPVVAPAAPSPVDVNVVSMPPTAPADVRIISAPRDNSGERLVTSTDRLADATALLAWLTGGVFAFTAALAGITLWVSRSQGRELARRDKDALAREVNRGAHRLRLDAERTRLLVSHREDRRSRVNAMMGNSGGKVLRDMMEKSRDEEAVQLEEISKSTDDIAGPGIDAFKVLGALSPADLARRQWTLDAKQALVDVMREAAEAEIARIEAERVRYLNEGAMYRAAKMGKPDPHMPT